MPITSLRTSKLTNIPNVGSLLHVEGEQNSVDLILLKNCSRQGPVLAIEGLESCRDLLPALWGLAVSVCALKTKVISAMQSLFHLTRPWYKY